MYSAFNIDVILGALVRIFIIENIIFRSTWSYAALRSITHKYDGFLVDLIASRTINSLGGGSVLPETKFIFHDKRFITVTKPFGYKSGEKA